MSDHSLTELQLEIMRVLWDRDEATVLEVRKALRSSRDLAQTTVATLMSRLEKKGVLERWKEGRESVHRAAVEESRVRRSVVSEFSERASRLFEGDVAELVNHLLAENDVEADDLARVRALIEAKEDELRDGGDR